MGFSPFSSWVRNDDRLSSYGTQIFCFWIVLTSKYFHYFCTMHFSGFAAIFFCAFFLVFYWEIFKFKTVYLFCWSHLYWELLGFAEVCLNFLQLFFCLINASALIFCFPSSLFYVLLFTFQDLFVFCVNLQFFRLCAKGIDEGNDECLLPSKRVSFAWPFFHILTLSPLPVRQIQSFESEILCEYL